LAFYGAFDALLRRVNDQDGGRPLFQQCLAVGEFFTMANILAVREYTLWQYDSLMPKTAPKFIKF
jgi:hypothetical protein